MTLPLDLEHPKHQPEMGGYYDEHLPSKGFAGELAKHVYDNWDDDFFRNGLTFALGELVEDMIWHHRTEIQAAIDEAEANHFRNVRKAIVKTAIISKIRSSMVSKGDEEWDENDVRRQPAGAAGGRGGEFAPKGSGAYGRFRTGPVSRTEAGQVRGYKDSLQQAAEMFQLPRRGGGAAGGMSEAEAYRTAAMVANAYNSRLSPGLAKEGRRPKTMFIIRGPQGEMKMARSHFDDGGKIVLPPLGEGEEYFAAAPMPYENPITVGGKVTDIGTAFGLNEERAGAAGAVVQQASTSIKAKHSWGGFLGKMTQALVHATGATQSNNPGARVALHLANAAGAHGDEAAKVLGPHLRRLTYRYRGMEASPQAGQYSETARTGRQTSKATGKKESTEAFEAKLAQELVQGVKVKTGPRGTVQRRGGLPSDAALSLALKTGSTTPSEGFLLDRNGNVRSQAIGYADDHYLPFNLRKLHHLDGGSYVRSRAYGGPTTEDMAAAIAAGAKRITVVSKNGVFTVNFNPRLGQKRHRWGDARRTMVTRYGKILSAIQQNQIDSSAAEIGEGRGPTKLKLDGEGYEAALSSLQTNFPYFIRSVHYTPANEMAYYGQRANAGGEDTGYVRAYYLKPSKAMSGYADTNINTLRGLKHESYDSLSNYRIQRARDVFLKEEQRAAAPAQAAAAPGGIVAPGTRQAGTAGGTAERGQQPVQVGVDGTVLGTKQQEGAGTTEDRDRVFSGIGRDGSIDRDRMYLLATHISSAADDVLRDMKVTGLETDPRFKNRVEAIRDAYIHATWLQGEDPDPELVGPGLAYDGGHKEDADKEKAADAHAAAAEEWAKGLASKMGERHALIGQIRNVFLERKKHPGNKPPSPFDEPAFDVMQDMRIKEREFVEQGGAEPPSEAAQEVPEEQQYSGKDPWDDFQGSNLHHDYWQWGRASLLQKRLNALKAGGGTPQQIAEVNQRLAEAHAVKSKTDPSKTAVEYMQQQGQAGAPLHAQLTSFVRDHMPQEFGQSVDGAVERELIEDDDKRIQEAEAAAARDATRGPNPANRYATDLDDPDQEQIKQWTTKNGIEDDPMEYGRRAGESVEEYMARMKRELEGE